MTLALLEAGGIRLRRRRHLPRPSWWWRGHALDRIALAFLGAGRVRLRRRHLRRARGRWRGRTLDRAALAFLDAGGIRRRRYLRRATWSRRDGRFHRAPPLLGPSACAAGAPVGSR